MKLNHPKLIAAAAACLAFQGELMAGKRLLPQFGGAASVWCCTVLFFQLAVLGAYFGCRRLGQMDARIRNPILAALGLSGFLTLAPPLPAQEWLPLELQPLAALLPFAGLALGLFCATPLLHQQQADRRDFTIYAWSNAGALAGLLAYPFLVEPFTDLTVQNWAWAAGGSLLCLLALRDRAAAPAVSPPGRAGLGRTRWQWWVLPGLSSATLLATTNLLSFEASAGPLTWALPLALFLATYVWAFSGNRRASCGPFATVGLLALIVSHLVVEKRSASLLVLLLIAGGATMLACHVWLAETRDENTHGFYTAAAAGGAMGSALMVLVIPHITDGPVEFPILTVGTLSIAGFRWSGRIIRPILSTAAVVAFGATVAAESSGRAKEVARARTLYGCWRVTKEPHTQRYQLINNTTIHAEEDRANPQAATTYYGPETGFGKWLEEMKRTHAALDIGVVGLGAGTINRWLRPQDSITYYEIDAQAEKLARAWFTYLRRGRCGVVIGDGRKSLQKQAGGEFDIIVLDAFTGDAIPAHLLTREAGAIYRSHLKEGGLLAVHITNGHVALWPVAQGLARGLGLGCEYDKDGIIEWAILRAGLPPPSGRVLQWTDERNSIVSVLRRTPRDRGRLPPNW
ncbi:MAG: fused MFS/spermidine synthase [Verrucomicrobiota bacterium]|jgi:predicted O-methyltransferase YrrM